MKYKFKHSNLTPYAKLLYIFLHTNGNGPYKRSELYEQIGITDRSITNATNELVEKGLITTESRPPYACKYFLENTKYIQS